MTIWNEVIDLVQEAAFDEDGEGNWNWQPAAAIEPTPERPVRAVRLHRKLTDDELARVCQLDTIQNLDLAYCKGITDAGLAHARTLDLLELGLLYTRIGDEGLSQLEAWPRLKRLILRESKRFTGNGLANLKQLAALEWLDLTWCEQLGDEDLVHIGTLPALLHLDLVGLEITAAGVAYLTPLQRLVYLDFHRCPKIDDEALAYVAKFPALIMLDLTETQISDAGLAQLAGLENLEWIILRSTGITDAALDTLERLPKLRDVTLVDCENVSDVLIEQLQAARPELHVLR